MTNSIASMRGTTSGHNGAGLHLSAAGAKSFTLAIVLAAILGSTNASATEDRPRDRPKPAVAPLLVTTQKQTTDEAEESPETVDNLGAVYNPELAGPEIPEGSFYGPPQPKAKRGELGQIEWTEPTDHVPPALEEAVELVSANYPSALAARAALRAAEADVRASKWQRFPSVGVDLQYLDDQSKPQPQLTIRQPIWAGGRIGANIRRNKAAEDASSASYIETVLELALTTSQAYFEVARLSEREKLLEESKAEHERLVETMERRVEQEISPVADLELARSRLAQVEQEYTVTRAQRLTNLRILAELIADPTYDLGPMPHYDPDAKLTNLNALDDQAIAYDPTIHRLYAEANIARADRDASKAQLFPQVDAQYSRDEFLGSRIGVVVRSQTQGGLSQFADLRASTLRIDSSLEQIRVAEQRLRRDIESLVIQYEAAKARASISRSAASTAARVSASYTRQFIAGRRSWLDVMNALREAISAQISQSDAELNVMSAATQLQLQSGRWRPYFVEAGPAPADN